MTTPRRHAVHLLSALLTVAGLAAGCAGDEPTDKDIPLQTRTLAEVTRQVEADTAVVADAAGTPLINKAVTPAPCQGRGGETADDGRWYLSLAGNLAVEPAAQIATLEKIKKAWKAQGREITEDRTFEDGTRGAVSSIDPASRHTISVSTTKDLRHVAVISASTCYLPAAGESPLDEP